MDNPNTQRQQELSQQDLSVQILAEEATKRIEKNIKAKSQTYHIPEEVLNAMTAKKEWIREEQVRKEWKRVPMSEIEKNNIVTNKRPEKIMTSIDELISKVEELRKVAATLKIDDTYRKEKVAIEEREKKEAEERNKYKEVGSFVSGTVFFRQAEPNIRYMKLRPVSYILNSTLIAESLGSGKVLIANLGTGNTFFILGTELVLLANNENIGGGIVGLGRLAAKSTDGDTLMMGERYDSPRM